MIEELEIKPYEESLGKTNKFISGEKVFKNSRTCRAVKEGKKAILISNVLKYKTWGNSPKLEEGRLQLNINHPREL